MHILVLSTWFPYPPDNGSKARAHYLVRALGDKHEVTLIAFRPGGTSAAELPGNLKVVDVPADPFRYVNLPQWIKYVSPIPLAFWPSRTMQQVVDRAACATQWDAVVAIQTPVAQYAERLKHAPRVLDIDTSLSYQMQQRHERHSSIGTRFRTWVSWQKAHRYEKYVFQRFQACTVVSYKEVGWVASMVRGHGRRVEVIRNGVDCDRFRPGQYPIRPNTLIYNGALTYDANYDAMQYFLAHIYPRIRQQLPEVRLVITGSIMGVNTKNLALDDSVNLSGRVGDIRPLIGSSAACVVPIRQGSGTRLKILEAMAAGIPVVSTTKGAEGLDAVDGEHLLLADDPAVFANQTLKLLNSETLRRQLITNARCLVEQHYDWSQIGGQFVGVDEEAVHAAEEGWAT